MGEIEIFQRPPKIYLDTNHLINIAKVRKGQKLPTGQSEEDYKRLDEYIRSYCCLIFNPFAPLEWGEGKATVASAEEIAAIIDSAKLKYQLEMDTYIYIEEVLRECTKQDSNIRVPKLYIMQVLNDGGTFESIEGILATQVPDYFVQTELERFKVNGSIPTQIPVVSVRRWVVEASRWRVNHPDLCQKRIDDFNDTLLKDINGKDEYFKNRKKYQKDWLRRLKIEKILEAFNPGIDVDSVLDKIDVTKCPAVKLCWSVREKRMMAGNPPKDNDVDDYMFLPVVPYADIVLTEHNLREFIRQADNNLMSKVFSKTSDALSALENQGFTY